MTDKTFKLGVLFIIYAMLLVAGLCLAALEKTNSALSLIGGAAIILVLFGIFNRNDGGSNE